MIVGEIAGIGLMDIICIYLALWSLDIKTLLCFLDDDSFNRMINSSSLFLGVKEVVERKNSGPAFNILTALSNFENRLINILSFADKAFAISSNSRTLTGNV